jgi:eukaryotic-like serine/threonine-protein kinase
MAVASILPATRIGNYEILGSLGSGGMGVVYKARDLKLQRTVALKFLSADADQARVLREARAASVLDHNNIVAVHSVEQTSDGEWFLVMACYEGQTLEEILRDGAMPAVRAAGIAAQIARGLAHAHQRGLIHHDIKPANVIVTTDGIAKIVDFGLAHRFDMNASTQSVNFSGTLAYISPEQIQGGALDARSDIWSLGITRCLPAVCRSADAPPANRFGPFCTRCRRR